MSLRDSKSTIYGSLKSSRSSTTIFGSCISANTLNGSSSTNTIGSFHTARSCSTIYFSTKDDDSNTLNWTMNYGSFDELSDTSTLVDQENDTEDRKGVTSALEISMDIAHSPEAENGSQLIMSTPKNDTKEQPQESVQFMAEEDQQQERRDRQLSEKFANFKSLLWKKLVQVQDFFLIAAVSMLSIFAMSVSPEADGRPSSWSLVFWRASFQIVISVPFVWIGKRIICHEGGHCVPICSGILTSIATASWMSIDHNHLLGVEVTSVFYYAIPIVIFMVESLTRRSPFSVGASLLLFVFWATGVLAYSSQFWSSEPITQTWLSRGQDPMLDWPITNSAIQAEGKGFLGIFLASIGILAMSSAVVVTSVGKAHQWPLFLAWQGMGGLLASVIGLCAIQEYPEWPQQSWWLPIVISLFGFINNALIVVVVIKSSQERPFSNRPVIVAVIKTSIEAVALFFANFSDVQHDPTSWAAVTAFAISFFIVMTCQATRN